MFSANAMRLAVTHIGDIDMTVAIRMTDIDRRTVQADPRIVGFLIEQAIVDSRRHKVFHRITRNGFRNQLANERSCNTGVAVGEVKDIGLISPRRLIFKFTNTETLSARHAQAKSFKSGKGVPPYTPEPLDRVPEDSRSLRRHFYLILEIVDVAGGAQRFDFFLSAFPLQIIIFVNEQTNKTFTGFFGKRIVTHNFGNIMRDCVAEDARNVWLHAVGTIFFLAEIDSASEVAVAKILPIEIIVKALGVNRYVFQQL